MHKSLLESPILTKFVKGEIKSRPKERMMVRSEVRRVIKERFKDYEPVIFGSPPVNPAFVGNILSIEFTESPLEDNVSAELRYGVGNYKFQAVINNNIPSESHRRFSCFHECAHVFWDLMDEDILARRTPKPFNTSGSRYKDPREILCDITASEFLFYYPQYLAKLNSFSGKNDLCNCLLGLSRTFGASSEATARFFIENYPEKAFMIVIKEGFRKDEVSLLQNGRKIEPLPRIAYGVNNSFFEPYIPQNKSFAKDTFVYECYQQLASGCHTVDLTDLDWYNCSGRFRLAVIPDESWLVGVGVKAPD